MQKPFVYFLCTGNSCRSQMAEGFLHALSGGRVETASAGTSPSRLNPLAVQVMAERGVDISQHGSKGIDPELLERADLIITLCGDARETCPVTPPHVARRHWPLPDPARAEGTEGEILAVFRTVRDVIAGMTEELLLELEQEPLHAKA